MRGTVVAVVALIAAAGPVTAEKERYRLFDRWNVFVSGRYDHLETTIRVDSKTLGTGTKLKLEDKLGVSESDANAAVRLQWRAARRHLVGVEWAEIERARFLQVREELQVGDQVFPVDADLYTEFDIRVLSLVYSYFPVVRERVAVGFSVGIQVPKYRLLVEEPARARQVAAEVEGPFPYLGVQLRYGIAPRWRLASAAGYLSLSFAGFNGTQAVLAMSVEHLTFRHLGFGVGFESYRIDVDTGDDDWSGKVDSEILGGRLFARARW